MTRKRKRLLILGCGMAALAAAAAMVLSAFSNNLVFFYGPSELVAEGVHPGQLVRIGGLVERHSVVHEPGGRLVRFRVTDGKTDIAVVYDGFLPDLFREGQGVVAEGRLNGGGVFVASNVLAKHDEKYMPPEVAAALKKAGRWQEGGKPPL
ncbi:MAG TPA: cytochrome c maturation protein CcmE [Stellaceae bacterium]|nr:cytochrome c maturation protein CcmE [Stellaceae bacterium]